MLQNNIYCATHSLNSHLFISENRLLLRSESESALARAKKLLMDTVQCAKDNPSIKNINLVLKACEFFPKDFDPNPILLATEMFQETQSRNVKPTHETYTSMLSICIEHLTDDDSRKLKIMEKTFTKCCQDGLCSPLVWKLFRSHMPKEEFNGTLGRMLPSVQSKKRNVRYSDLPHKWSASC